MAKSLQHHKVISEEKLHLQKEEEQLQLDVLKTQRAFWEYYKVDSFRTL
jgi:hypothetical protein